MSKRSRIVAIGEILWDLLPAGKQLGGAPANFAYHAHALGADAQLISRVGNDGLGREIIDRVTALGLSPEGIAIDPVAPTGTVTVDIRPDGQPDFIIHDEVAWDHIAIPATIDADVVCFGSLAQRNPTTRRAICDAVAATSAGTLRVFDINLRQHYYSREVIESSLKLANALKLNDAELPVLAAMFGLPELVRDQISALSSRFAIPLVALTRGSAGSLLLADGIFSAHPGIRVTVVDAVGAGDAFTAAWILGLLAGNRLDAINERANRLAAFVCSQRGATPAYTQRADGTFAVI